MTFGATDAPLEPAELDKAGLAQWPMVMGGIVAVVNLPGVKPGGIVIDGPTLANIYLGKITKWNDPALKTLNPKLDLPNLPIVPIHRADGSGTTFNFTYYLGEVSPVGMVSGDCRSTSSPRTRRRPESSAACSTRSSAA